MNIHTDNNTVRSHCDLRPSESLEHKPTTTIIIFSEPLFHIPPPCSIRVKRKGHYLFRDGLPELRKRATFLEVKYHSTTHSINILKC